MSKEYFDPFDIEDEYVFPIINLVDPEPVFSESQHLDTQAGQVCFLSQIYNPSVERKSFMKHLEFSAELI